MALHETERTGVCLISDDLRLQEYGNSYPYCPDHNKLQTFAFAYEGIAIVEQDMNIVEYHFIHEENIHVSHLAEAKRNTEQLLGWLEQNNYFNSYDMNKSDKDAGTTLINCCSKR